MEPENTKPVYKSDRTSLRHLYYFLEDKFLPFYSISYPEGMPTRHGKKFVLFGPHSLSGFPVTIKPLEIELHAEIMNSARRLNSKAG